MQKYAIVTKIQKYRMQYEETYRETQNRINFIQLSQLISRYISISHKK